MTDRDRYSSISIINHWVTALLVVVMIALGFVAGATSSDEIVDYILDVHIAPGFFVFIFVVWRVLFKLYKGFPVDTSKTVLESWAA
ncbi:MAG: cytochrome b/b6 domain-containing protein [Pseudomonadales bacterium]